MSGEMFPDRNIAYIGAGTAEDVCRIAQGINANYFMPPLDVYVFYGSSQKGLESRWCVGFNDPNANCLIEMLTIQDRFVFVDSVPQSWITKNGNSYSVVLYTGVTEPQLAKETVKQLLVQRVNSCLNAIFNTTFRKLNPILIQ